MDQKTMNFIRATARGAQRAIDELLKDQQAHLVDALTAMTGGQTRPLRAEEVGYYAIMYLAAHGWQVPPQQSQRRKKR